MPHDVFISHSSSDKQLAEKLMATLEARNVVCWAAMRDALFGPTYAKQIVDAIRNAKVMILIFSADANDSPHILREVEKAVDLRVPLITVRVQNISPNDDLDYFLKVCHWMDAFNGPFEAHAEKLAAQVRGMIDKPAGAPTAPKVRAAPVAVPAPAPVAAAPAPVSVAPSAPAAEGELPEVARGNSMGKMAGIAAGLVVAIGAAGWFMWTPQSQASSARSEHYLTADEVRSQIAGELAQAEAGGKTFKVTSVPVTRQQFASFVHDRIATTAAEDLGRPYTWKEPGFHQADGDPVVCVDWNDAKAFCDWLGTNYRLPTEVELAAAGRGVAGGSVWLWAADDYGQAGKDSSEKDASGKDAAAKDAPGDGNEMLKVISGPSDSRLALPASGAVNNVGFRVATDG